MGARWAWSAICETGHIYSNFSGGADECYECGKEPLLEVSEDGMSPAEVNAALWTALAEYERAQRVNHCYACGKEL